MYRVMIYCGEDTCIIHSGKTDPSAPHLYSCTLTQGAPGEIDTLQFVILPNNPGYELLNSRTTFVEVLNTKTGVTEFYGRVLTISPEMQDSGIIYKTVVCEDRLGYLCDSIQPFLAKTTYYDDGERTGVEQFLDLVLENHNSQVEDYKKIYRGDVTFSTNTNNITKGLTYETTWETISQKLLTDLGGEVQLREGDDGLLYLDYVEELGDHIDTVAIKFGENMRSVAREIDPTSIITRLIPLGAHLEADEGDTDDYVTIASVNNGVLYIDDESAQETYGIVVGTVTWEDVTEPSNLLSKAIAWLQTQSLSDSITVSALDLSLIGLADDSLERYNYYNVVNDKVGLNSYFRVIKKTINICDPSDTTFELGEKSQSLASTIISTQLQAKSQATEYASAVKRLNDKLDSASGIYITTEEQDDGSEIYYMHNKSTLADSDIVWKMTAEAFGISTDGGASYPYGFSATGEVIAERLYTVGINADYINTGALTVKDSSGNVIFCADVNGKSLTINTTQLVLDSSGNATFSGALNAATGTFAGELKAATGTFSGSLNAATGSFSGTITASGGTIGGWVITSSRIRSSSGVSIGGNVAGLMFINETDKPYINAQDGNGNTTFQIGRDGSALFAGELNAATGTFSGSLNAATGTFSGSLNAATGTFTGEVKASYLTATNSIYINNSSGTAKLVLNAPNSSFGNALNVGGGFSTVHLNGTVYTGGALYVAEDGTGNVYCGNISLTGAITSCTSITASGIIKTDSFVYAGDSASMWTDSEGGNLQLVSPAAYTRFYQMDSFDGTLRIYCMYTGDSGAYDADIDKYLNYNTLLSTITWNGYNGTLMVNGLVYGTAWVSLSDERKKNIVELDERYTALFNSMSAFAFTWKSGLGGKQVHLGVGAQTTQKVMTECGFSEDELFLVQYDEAEDSYGVAYNELGVLTMYMTQKNMKSIEELQAKIAALQAQIAVLQASA